MDKDPPFLPPSLSPWSAAEASKYLHGALTDQIIACAIEVHRELGPGFIEAVYERAFALELDRQRLAYLRQHPVVIRFRGIEVGMHRVDLVIDQKVVVELKAVKAIDDAHLATCLSYLKATRLRVGLIVNFSEAKTRIKRVMRSADMQTTETGREGEREDFLRGRRTSDGANALSLSQTAGHKDVANGEEGSLPDPQLG